MKKNTELIQGRKTDQTEIDLRDAAKVAMDPQRYAKEVFSDIPMEEIRAKLGLKISSQRNMENLPTVFGSPSSFSAKHEQNRKNSRKPQFFKEKTREELEREVFELRRQLAKVSGLHHRGSAMTSQTDQYVAHPPTTIYSQSNNRSSSRIHQQKNLSPRERRMKMNASNNELEKILTQEKIEHKRKKFRERERKKLKVRQKRREREKAAIKIQSITRGNRQRRTNQKNKQLNSELSIDGNQMIETDLIGDNDKEIATRKIQAIHRGRSQRKKHEKLKKEAAQERIKRVEATKRIQAIQRGRYHRKKHKQELTERIAATKKIQAIQRGRYHRKKHKQEHAERIAATRKIQAIQRGRAQRKMYKKLEQEHRDKTSIRRIKSERVLHPHEHDSDDSSIESDEEYVLQEVEVSGSDEEHYESLSDEELLDEELLDEELLDEELLE